VRVGRAALSIAAVLIVGVCAGMLSREARWPVGVLLVFAPFIAGGWGLVLKPGIATALIGSLFMGYGLWIGFNFDEAHWKKMPWTGPMFNDERVIALLMVVLCAGIAWALPRAFKWVIGEEWGS
jgi:hypothetical protein